MTEYIFKTPTVAEGPAGGRRLFYFYKIDRGLTVVKLSGTWSLTRYLVDSDLASYDVVYIGGCNHQVDAATKSELIAADIGITESNFTAI